MILARTSLVVFVLTQCISAQVSSPAPIPPVSSSLTTAVIVTSSNPSGIPLATSVSGSRNTTATTSATTEDVTAIVGLSPSTTSGNGTVLATTSTRPQPSNTQPCNGHVEFCDRKFSNISMVVAHNSPFVRPHNAASNQLYAVLNQLNDGIRGLQFETQKPNSSSAIRLCHTSCDLLDVGTLETYLATVKGWLDSNPYEVIAIVMGNNNGQSTRIPATDYVQPFTDSGILQYLWTPPSSNLNLTDWPSLAEMIIRNKRVVVMLDYGTDQDQVPWLLSEFDYQWETPFSPTDPSFPCTQQRPPNQAEEVSRTRMYMMNHNLNIEISLSGMDGILIPAYSLLDSVNAESGNGSLGLNVQNCEAMWGRPPNWLLVDYYNFGNFNGSVFQVAAAANNVSYNRDACCGSATTSGAIVGKGSGLIAASVLLVMYFIQ
ncbi:PLC-like phosphodiesterase [Pyrenochaeta sp. MPI-SDFR-AT-0127]|nr:PLC-like phosphodiesterase [Pyrenochaeta sp. MPI-SDFR-AT-0127]